MAWKINKMTIENFKFFLKPFIIEPKGKHVLMYGENGSGKSSIYWAAYTHFQSCLKQPADAAKYFDKNHSDNLVNLYDTHNSRSGIEIEFVKPDTLQTKSYTDGSWIINTKSDDFISLSTYASDFMNYKFLSAIFDFKNSRPVDLFKIFEDEIFPFIPMGAQRYDLDGTMTGETSVEQWWRYIEECYYTPGVLNRRSSGGVFVHDDKWQAYQNLITDFNRKLQNLLTDIANEANTKLREQKMPVSVKLTLDKVQFDKKMPGTTRSYDGEFYKPHIILTAQLLDSDGNPVSPIEIKHPRSFFNEAKLTRMALALRLAIFDRKYQGDDCAKVIFVDDLLISLDMSNRLMVVKELLNYAGRYQMFIFTHDRTFYDLIHDSIAQRNMSNDWCYYEMYAIDEQVSDGQVPEPWIKVKQNYMQQARSFFSDYEYHASANSLRKECEKQLLRLYPHNWTIFPKADGTVSILNLNGLDQKLNQFYDRFGTERIFTPNIDQYRSRILNPASHNDSKAKVFRSELILAIDEISQFEKINKLRLSDENNVSQRVFVMEMDNGTKHVVIEFVPLEEWYKLEYEGNTYFENIEVEVKSISGFNPGTDRLEIRKLWRDTCRFMGITPESAFPAIETVIRDKNTDVFLRDLPVV